MGNVIKKYSRSVNSSNLKCDEYHFDTDYLAAVAMSGDLGNFLFRTKYANDPTSYRVLLIAWVTKVERKAAHRNWPQHIVPARIAKMALDYWLTDPCPACTGRGWEIIPGTPIRSDEACKACQGQGKRPVRADKRIIEYVKDMVEALEELTLAAQARAKAKLAKDTDL